MDPTTTLAEAQEKLRLAKEAVRLAKANQRREARNWKEKIAATLVANSVVNSEAVTKFVKDRNLTITTYDLTNYFTEND